MHLQLLPGSLFPSLRDPRDEANTINGDNLDTQFIFHVIYQLVALIPRLISTVAKKASLKSITCEGYLCTC